jgi:DHA1 family tetracycline resistance protein-like MFS transporter
MGAVYFTVFLDLLGFGIILPIMPYFAESLGASGVWLGALMTAYSVAQFLGAPLIGSLSDRYGRRPVLLLAIAGSGVSMAFSGFASELSWLLFARIFAGFFGGSIAAAQAYIADMTTPETRAKKMGLLGACIGLGFVFGPALGALLSDYGFQAAAWTAAGLNFINLIWGYFKIKEPAREAVARSNEKMFSLKKLWEIAQLKPVRPIISATFLASLGFVAMETTYALLGARLYQMESKMLGTVFTLIGVVMVVVQGGFVGRLSSRFGPRKLAIYGLVINGTALIMMPFAPTLAWSLGCQSLLAVGQGLSSPTLSTLLSQQVGGQDQGKTLGLGQSLAAFARGIGPLAAGILFDVSYFLPYLVAGGLGLISAYLVTALRSDS